MPPRLSKLLAGVTSSTLRGGAGNDTIISLVHSRKTLVNGGAGADSFSFSDGAALDPASLQVLVTTPSTSLVML